MKGFLKGYYGYKNLGDEIIFFGITNYIFENYKIDKLYVEVGNIDRMNLWLTKNELILGDLYKKIEFVDKNFKYKENKIDMLFIGGGEVISDQRNFPHNGRNYLLKYLRQLYLGKIVFLGGIGKTTKLFSKLMYNYLLSNANEIIVRDKISFDIAQNYNSKVVLYEDFAKKIVEHIKTNKTKNNRMLININPYIYNEDSLLKIDAFLNQENKKEIYFVPFDINEDMALYEKLISRFSHRQILLYDWTKDNVDSVVQFLSTCQCGIGARLHFLLILNWLGKKVQPLFYQEKIHKFFGKHNS